MYDRRVTFSNKKCWTQAIFNKNIKNGKKEIDTGTISNFAESTLRTKKIIPSFGDAIKMQIIRTVKTLVMLYFLQKVLSEAERCCSSAKQNLRHPQYKIS